MAKAQNIRKTDAPAFGFFTEAPRLSEGDPQFTGKNRPTRDEKGKICLGAKQIVSSKPNAYFGWADSKIETGNKRAPKLGSLGLPAHVEDPW